MDDDEIYRAISRGPMMYLQSTYKYQPLRVPTIFQNPTLVIPLVFFLFSEYKTIAPRGLFLFTVTTQVVHTWREGQVTLQAITAEQGVIAVTSQAVHTWRECKVTLLAITAEQGVIAVTSQAVHTWREGQVTLQAITAEQGVIAVTFKAVHTWR